MAILRPNYLKPASASLYEVEALEGRQLLSTNWGYWPITVGQAAEVSDFPQINGAKETIAVIDNVGINYNDPALGGGLGSGHKVIGGQNEITGSSDPFAYTPAADGDLGHETGIASILAANPFSISGSSYQGVAPGANLVALVVSTTTDIANALQYVINNRVADNIVAVDLGFTAGGGAHNTPYDSQLATLQNDGVYVGVPVGNDFGGNPRYPAAGTLAFSAGAINVGGAFSPRNDASAIDPQILAPGEQVPLVYYTSSGSLDFLSPDSPGETSWAVPYAVATAALMKQVNPNLTPAQINSLERSSATSSEIDPANGVTYPVLNVDAAVKAAFASLSSNPTPPPTNPAPTPSKISGTVFLDRDDDGVKESKEVGIAKITVTLQQFRRGKAVGHAATTTTDTNGNYSFTKVAAGTYRLSDAVPRGDKQTAPAGGAYTLSVTGGQNFTGDNFGDLSSKKAAAKAAALPFSDVPIAPTFLPVDGIISLFGSDNANSVLQ